MTRTKLVLLGTGTPSFRPGLAQQSSAVIVDDTPYIIDSGGGSMQRIAQAQGRGVAGLEFPKLTRVFLTHLHPDHVAGLPDMLVAPWVKSRIEPLRIFGPAGTRHMVEKLLSAFEVGINEHRYGLAAIQHDLVAQVQEVDAGNIYQDEYVTVEAFRVEHGTLDAFGFKFVTPDKSIVFSGDTARTDVMIEQARDCDFLVHEVCSARSLEFVSAEWRKYHSTVHTLTHELADIASQARPGTLILTHQLLFGDVTEDDVLHEVQASYDGEVVYGRDLDEFT